jgi:hypothetical protein
MDNSYAIPVAPIYIANQGRGLIYNSIFIGLFIGLALALILLSTPNDRRGLIFPVQCLALSMTLVYCSLEVSMVNATVKVDLGLIPAMGLSGNSEFEDESTYKKERDTSDSYSVASFLSFVRTS